MNRRAFLKTSAGFLAASAVSAVFPRVTRAGECDPDMGHQPPAPYTPTAGPGAGPGFLRPFYAGIPVYSAPDIKSKAPARLKANDYPAILAELEGANGNWHNKRWYQIDGGYIFSAHACPTPNEPQTPFTTAGDGGFWGEISVPYTDARFAPSAKAGRTKYRYFGGCTAKVSKVVPATDNPAELWYQLEDEMKPGVYFVPGKDVRPISQEEFTPLGWDVSPSDKKLVVNLSKQRATAYEKGRELFSWSVATGAKFSEDKDFQTPPGNYFVFHKTPTQHMFGGEEGTDEYYDLPGVPWVSYFTGTGIAFHGAYWHNDFGVMRSHGCVNCPNHIAKWVWRWTMPMNDYSKRYTGANKREEGTQVVVMF